MATNAQKLGNQFGLRCPTCLRGDDLRIVASTWVRLFPDGSESDGDQEWEKRRWGALYGRPLHMGR